VPTKFAPVIVTISEEPANAKAGCAVMNGAETNVVEIVAVVLLVVVVKITDVWVTVVVVLPVSVVKTTDVAVIVVAGTTTKMA
jgi:hypothetical protein